MLKVMDVMTPKVVCVSPSTPVIEVAYKMKVAGVTLTPVCSRSKFRGVITAGDIVTRLVANGIDPVTTSAVSIMNSNYPLISPDAYITEAAKIMAKNNIRVLPVVQSSRLLGLVSLYDVTLKGML